MKKPTISARRCVSALILMLSIAAVSAFAQTSAFTYQGRFTDATVTQPTNGTYSMTFRLYDALTGGNQIGSPVTTSVSVVNGIFAAQLDFGATAFDTTSARYLEMQVGASVLTPRQQITSTPFSIRASNSATADALSANCSLCVLNSQLATNSVSTSKIINGSVSELKIADEAVTSLKIANGAITDIDVSTSANINGAKINGSTLFNMNAANLASGTVPVARLGTNTPGATTYLRGDNTWQPVSGGGSTSPFASRATGLTLTSNTYVDVLSINLEANKTYFLETLILGQRVGSTNGGGTCQLVYSGTATTDYGLSNGTFINDTVIDSTPSFDNDATGQGSTYGSALSNRYNLTGYLRTTTAGTMTIRCARAAANTTVDLSIREGSYFVARPVN